MALKRGEEHPKKGEEGGRAPKEGRGVDWGGGETG